MIAHFNPGHAIISAIQSPTVIGRIRHSVEYSSLHVLHGLLSPRKGLVCGRVVLVDVR